MVERWTTKCPPELREIRLLVGEEAYRGAGDLLAGSVAGKALNTVRLLKGATGTMVAERVVQLP